MQNKDEEISKKSHIKNPILASFILFLLAEFCDKTQLSTMLFAAKYDSTYQVFLGGVLGMILADSLGIVLGFILNKYISPNVFKFVGGLLFVFFGVYGIVTNIPLDRLNPIINTAAILFGIGSLMISILLLKSRNSKKM